jgi:hypothetical protein
MSLKPMIQRLLESIRQISRFSGKTASLWGETTRTVLTGMAGVKGEIGLNVNGG